MEKEKRPPVVIRPEWIDTAKLSLVNRKSKKEYLRFLEILGEIVSNGELTDEFCDDSKAYKLFKSLQIMEKIDTDLTRFRKKKARYFNESDSEKTDNKESNSGILHKHIQDQYSNNANSNTYNTGPNTITKVNANCNADALDMSADFAELDNLF